jgi:mRNA interferase MazF
MKINRGAVWWVNLDPTLGAEIKKRRPCVIISHSIINEVRRTVVVVPLSTSSKEHAPITISVMCQNTAVVGICDQIRTVDKSRLVSYIEELSSNDMQKLESGLKKVLVL